MKTKIFITATFMATVFSGWSQYPKHITTGSYMGDPTAEHVYSAFVKVNENFTDIYGKVISGPVCGTKYEDLKTAVKYVWLTPVFNNYYYFIRQLKAATTESNKYRYMISINYASTVTGTQTGIAGGYTVLSDSVLTGTYACAIKSGMTPGGLTGTIVINFSQLTTGTTYTCTNFLQGGIFSINSSGSSGGGGGGGGTITEGGGSTTRIDGSSSVYKYSRANHRIILDTMKNIKQNFTLIYLDTGTVKSNVQASIIPSVGLHIDGKDSIIIHPGQVVTILADSNQFQSISAGSSLEIRSICGQGVDTTAINTTDPIFIGYSDGIVIDTIVCWLYRRAGTPDVTAKVYFGTDPSSAGTVLATAGTQVTSYTAKTTTSGASLTNATITADKIIWFKFSAVSVIPKGFYIVLKGHKI